ncbi:MAG: histidine kinase [Clostridia bacterium]|nr:histidine kinase [Clostridia bacterium]
MMIQAFQKFWDKNKIRKRLILYFMLTTFLMALTSFYTYYNARMLMVRMNGMFTSNVYLNDLTDTLNRVEQNLETYLSTKQSDSLRQYWKNHYELKAKAEKIQKDFSANESSLIIKDIRNMIDTYLVETEAAVNAKRGRDVTEYIQYYNEANKIFNYINIYINKLNNSQFKENTERYMITSGRLDFVQILNIGVIIAVVLFNTILILWFTYKITQPIIKLSHAADEISKGNFDVDEVNVYKDDEIGIMAQAFNRMASSIRLYFDEIKEKAELESRLKEQEMQNLSMKAHLKEAELHALQSQINPHFIFNTLNAGAQLAMLEGADKTCIFVENVASLFRYNLKKLDKPVTLREEINNINTYIYILKARFADRIEFYTDIDDKLLDVKMPCMILQPLVENAFIHGIGEMETGGRIGILVENEKDKIVITVKDNGKGMQAEQIMHFLEEGDTGVEMEQSNSGHTTGIGLNNVISRLRLFFNREDVFDIHSVLGNGSEMIIRIPAGT